MVDEMPGRRAPALGWLATVAVGLLVTAGCGGEEDDAGEGGAGPGAVPSLPSSAGEFERRQGNGRSATYADRAGGTVRVTLTSTTSAEAAARRLRSEVARRRQVGWQRERAGGARGGGRLVVLLLSPGVQARPPERAYVWTVGGRVLTAEGVGDAPGRWYEAADL